MDKANVTDDARPSECVWTQNKEEGTLKCTECTGRVHWTCTELPVYQLCVFIKTHRRYTCRPCVKAFMDDRTTEGIELVKTVRQTTEDRQSLETTRYNDIVYSQLHANHQTTATLLQNLEMPINNLAGQVHRVKEIRGDAIAHLADTLSAGHQDRQPAATVDRSTQTTPTQTVHPTVTTDRAVQVSGRALPLPPPSPALPPPHPFSLLTPTLPSLHPSPVLYPRAPPPGRLSWQQGAEEDHCLQPPRTRKAVTPMTARRPAPLARAAWQTTPTMKLLQLWRMTVSPAF